MNGSKFLLFIVFFLHLMQLLIIMRNVMAIWQMRYVVVIMILSILRRRM